MSDLKFWDVFRDPLWLLHNFQARYKHIRMPTNSGWTAFLVNGGAGQGVTYLRLNTSVTASSSARAVHDILGLTSGNTTADRIDWDKRLEYSFIFQRINSDAQVVARIQLKLTNVEGLLANRGVGLEINNLTVVGEAYGTARQTTGTLKILTSNWSVRAKIVVTATSVEFWVDGVLVESLTGTAVPTGIVVASSFEVVSIINGVTGGVNAYLDIGNIEVVQAW